MTYFKKKPEIMNSSGTRTALPNSSLFKSRYIKKLAHFFSKQFLQQGGGKARTSPPREAGSTSPANSLCVQLVD